jgi:reductive dehalogenase
VSTELELAPDDPLAPRNALAKLKTDGPTWWLGAGGTTLIIDEEVPRVPQRASFFDRPKYGDMGPKFEEHRKVFAFKTPTAQAYLSMIGSMVPHQDGPVETEPDPTTLNPRTNADAVKAMATFLGGDMVGVCKAPEYVWYSHDANGEEITPYHRNAIVILLDQEYETMEGASGDDWISGAQSMRAYMRGAEIAGIMAEHIRSLGWSATSQTNALSHVLHVPLVLNAGLGELSRIGELVLNPFLGPPMKSVVVTTDMPLTADKHVDFGLQDFCNKCTKCARECPCGAISFGDKVMFNGYEMWKSDSEKCAKYRLGNLRCSACGRCMKTCPFNTEESLLTSRMWLWTAIKFPFTRKKIAHWDDKAGNGSINPVKKWWWDLEWVSGKTVEPLRGTNERELDLNGRRIAESPDTARARTGR